MPLDRIGPVPLDRIGIEDKKASRLMRKTAKYPQVLAKYYVWTTEVAQASRLWKASLPSTADYCSRRNLTGQRPVLLSMRGPVPLVDRGPCYFTMCHFSSEGWKPDGTLAHQLTVGVQGER